MSRVGDIGFEPLDLDRHLELLHAWVTHPRSVYWEMQDATPDDVRAEYARIAADPHHHALLGTVDGRPAFLMEHYDPAHSELAGHLVHSDGYVGMHVLVAPREDDAEPVPGFTDAVFAAVMHRLFDDPPVTRVVVEPDARNEAIRAKNVAAGFVELGEIDLPTKTAMLSTCSREAFAHSRLGAVRGGAHVSV
ncbi:GNAT family N-acetyltransferase [Aeromicrobium sp. Leaf350]|uniref:GNAT family N-acetyltransferase n=1 Tax=Aeromicrobium sp. Leaf350 TaxID=2876565 RepID=UPI001E64A75D|nr:GNAT family N-acetyltransferase [Aeromicrobium sp. Leaf350]